MEFVNNISQHLINSSNKLMSIITNYTGMSYLSMLASVVFLSLILEMISSNGRTRVSMLNLIFLVGSTYLAGTRGLIFITSIAFSAYLYIKIIRVFLRKNKKDKMYAAN